MKEFWKDIPGYENYYQASNMGNIRSVERDVINIYGYIRHLSSKILSPSISKCGYYRVVLCVENKHNYIPIHQLVAKTFLQYDQTARLTVNHIDGDKCNNAVNNLEVVTQKENRRHAIQMGLWNQRGEFSKVAKLNKAQVLAIRASYQNSEVTHKELADLYQVSKSTIGRIINNQSYVY